MRRLSACLALVAMSGCISIAHPFVRMKPDFEGLPTEALQQVATDIEAVVKAGEREPEITPREGITIDNALIQQAIRTRAARHELIEDLLAGGHARELRNGLLETIRNKEYKKSTTRRERSRHALVVMGENQDRWNLYEEMVRANNFPRKTLSAIQACFFEARVALMNDGQAYEGPSGDTVLKGQ